MPTPKTVRVETLQPILGILATLAHTSYMNCLGDDEESSYDYSITDGQRDAIKKVLKALGYEEEDEEEGEEDDEES